MTHTKRASPSGQREVQGRGVIPGWLHPNPLATRFTAGLNLLRQGHTPTGAAPDNVISEGDQTPASWNCDDGCALCRAASARGTDSVWQFNRRSTQFLLTELTTTL